MRSRARRFSRSCWNHWIRFAACWQRTGKDSILRAFTSASSYVANRRVLVEETGWKGMTAGLDEDGFLLIRDDNGTVHRVASGGVRPDYA